MRGKASIWAAVAFCPFCVVQSREVWPLFLVAWSAAFLGSLLLLIWSILRGQFKDTEKPKYEVLEAEQKE